MKKKKNAQTIFFYNTLISNILVFFVVLITVVSVLFSNTYNIIKDTRLEVLAKQADTNRMINGILIELTEDVFRIWEKHKNAAESQNHEDFVEAVRATVGEKENLLYKLDLYPSIWLIMDDGYTYLTGIASEDNIRSIQSSYWYITNRTNPKESFWTSVYNFSGDVMTTDTMYGKTVFDKSGNYQGIIAVSLQTDFLDENSDILSEKGTVRYIMDENGIAIVHSIKSLLGSGLYYMPYFWDNFEPNSSRILKKNAGMVLHTNYYDEETGWVIVEEKELSTLWDEFSNIIAVSVVLLLLAILFSGIASYMLARKFSKPIVTMSAQMVASEEGEIDHIDLQQDYQEVMVLSNIYNMTVSKMNQLIIQNKEEEQKKRKLELAFLQAQINPHFLHNTLFSIKCLIEMNKQEKADIMVTNLMKMLKNPINVNKEWITIKDELAYLQSYILLMQTRYEQRKIVMDIDVNEDLENFLIPRLLLQPIIENSIFHGFEDDKQPAVIGLVASIIEKRLIIRIRDNGKGMSETELNNLWNTSQKSSEGFNRIGLVNIQQRIKLLYGESYGIVIMSNKGEGTETIITLKCVMEEDIDGQNNGSR